MAYQDQGRQEHGWFGHGTDKTTDQRKVRGNASYYNPPPGSPMANRQPYDPNAMNAAMLNVPLGTKVTVTSVDDPTKSIEVTVTDHGPYIAGRVIDLTPRAFKSLFGSTARGVGGVIVLVPNHE